MGWKVPVVKTTETDWEPYALEVLAGIIDGGDSARFARELVRGQEVAASVGAGYGLFSRLDEVFVVAGTPAQDNTITDLKDAVIAQLELLKQQEVTDEELARVKAQVVANAVYERDSVFYQAMQIGMLDTIGLDWKLSDAYVENVKKVTAQQILMVANKYFVDDGLTEAELIPQALENQTMNPSAGARHGR